MCCINNTAASDECVCLTNHTTTSVLFRLLLLLLLIFSQLSKHDRESVVRSSLTDSNVAFFILNEIVIENICYKRDFYVGTRPIEK